jgi:hypothetical protein
MEEASFFSMVSGWLLRMCCAHMLSCKFIDIVLLQITTGLRGLRVHLPHPGVGKPLPLHSGWCAQFWFPSFLGD